MTATILIIIIITCTYSSEVYFNFRMNTNEFDELPVFSDSNEALCPSRVRSVLWKQWIVAQAYRIRESVSRLAAVSLAVQEPYCTLHSDAAGPSLLSVLLYDGSLLHRGLTD